MKINPLQLTRSQVRFDESERNINKVDHRFATIKVSIDLESQINHIRERALYMLNEEIELAEYLGIKGIVFELLIYPELEESYYPENFCKVLASLLKKEGEYIVIRVPLYIEREGNFHNIESGEKNLSW